MTLEETLEKVISLLESNSQVVLYGAADRDNLPRVKCDSRISSIEDFLEIGMKVNAKIFTIGKFVFDLPKIQEEIDSEELEDLKQIELNNLLQQLASYDGLIQFLLISFIVDGVVYEYELISDWMEDFQVLHATFEELMAGERLEDEATSHLHRLPPEEIQILAKKLAHKKRFLFDRFKQARFQVLVDDVLAESETYDKEKHWFSRNEVINTADKYFEKNLRAQKESELIQEISELKDQGLSKVEMRSNLEISERMLNKYYHR